MHTCSPLLSSVIPAASLLVLQPLLTLGLILGHPSNRHHSHPVVSSTSNPGRVLSPTILLPTRH
ncbi:hypothetical protein PF010_g27466 [Phytophthora fragariae]|uniref:RxLR effector protein n=1 Tax=Phytophthora fragariae TaxID=53985 RepID=A0A6A4BJ91_9STRA|nr:hypothetical protein PF010_g27466 [Phytophthora fragariae]KAE9272545.1 hypothetical protein PF001_g27890 [Phytophthora fragariae]